MRILALTLLILTGCGAPITALPASEVVKPTGIQYCAMAKIKYDKGVHDVFVCTPSEKLCKKGVRDARGTAGRIIGVKSVTDCKLILH